LALAKPMKQSKKFISQSLGHSVTDESSSMTVKISGGGGTSSASTGGGVATPALTRALNLFDSGSSTSDDAAAVLVPH
jgi:hypothetical protein